MPPVLQIGNETITCASLIKLLAGYGMLPKLRRELIIERAIAQIECTPSEHDFARQQFYSHHQLTGEAEQMAWCFDYGMSAEQLEALAVRELKIEKFKQASWGHQLEAYFLTQKSRLDKVIYSLIRTLDAEIAQELYFRIKAEEQSFAECAKAYSTGEESQTGGVIGPIECSQLHPSLAKILFTSQSGQLSIPTHLGEWFCIVRLEKLLPAQLDNDMRQQLLNELFEAWLQEEISNNPTTIGNAPSPVKISTPALI